MDAGKIFAENLKRYRIARNMSLSQLADFANASASSIRKYEYGEARLPRIKTLAALANALDVSANDLLTGLYKRTEVDDLAELKLYLIENPGRELRLAQSTIETLLKYLEPHAKGITEASFGKRIKLLREDMGLRYEDVAKACSISAGHLKQIESAQTYPKTSTFLSICNLMGGSPNYFMRNMLRRPAASTGLPLLDRVSDLTPRQIKLIIETVRQIIND